MAVQRQPQLVAQRVQEQQRHPPAALLQAGRDQAVEEVGVGQPAGRRPAAASQVAQEEGLGLVGQAAVGAAGLAGCRGQLAGQVQQVAGCGLELALGAVDRVQAAQVEVQQRVQAAAVLGQEAAAVLAGLDQPGRGVEHLPLGLALTAAGPHRAGVAGQRGAHGIQIAPFQRQDGRAQAGALLEGEGGALAQVRQVMTARGQVQRLLHLLGAAEVGGHGALVVAQTVAQVLDQGAGSIGRAGHLGQAGRQLARQVEGQLAPQQEAPQFGRQQVPTAAAGQQRQAQAGLAERLSFSQPGVAAAQRPRLSVRGGQQGEEDVPGRLDVQGGLQGGPARARKSHPCPAIPGCAHALCNTGRAVVSEPGSGDAGCRQPPVIAAFLHKVELLTETRLPEEHSALAVGTERQLAVSHGIRDLLREPGETARAVGCTVRQRQHTAVFRQR